MVTQMGETKGLAYLDGCRLSFGYKRWYIFKSSPMKYPFPPPMLTPPSPLSPPTRDLVLIGGGHAHVAVVRAFGMRAEVGVRVTLVSREAEAAYSGMVPGVLAGHYGHEEAHVDLRRLCGRAGVRFVEAAATGIDLAGRVVHLGGGRPGLRFDVLSLDTGSTPSVGGIAGAREHGLAVKPVAGFLAGWAAAEQRMRAAQAEGGANAPFRVLVIGGGAGGVVPDAERTTPLADNLVVASGSFGSSLRFRTDSATR